MSPPRLMTMARVAPTRLPEHARRRLTKLAVHGGDALRRHAKALRPTEPERARRADLCAEMALGLELALMDLAGAELRALNAEGRARRAESELAAARKEAADLQLALAQRAHEEFDEPTRSLDDPDLIERCRQGGA